MDEQFKNWLLARGEDPEASQENLSELRIEFEEEQQASDYETVAEYFVATDCEPSERTALDNFAFYMLGWDRRCFRQACNIRPAQAQDIHKKCWSAFHAWVDWVNDVSLSHDS